MVREETIKILSVLKAAYPMSYKGMTKREANGIIELWNMQFANVPYYAVSMAVTKLISTNAFPPSISEIKTAIDGLYWSAWCDLNVNNTYKTLSDKDLLLLKQTLNDCSPSNFRGITEIQTLSSGEDCATMQIPADFKR